MKSESLQDVDHGDELEAQPQANISEMPILPASISDELSGYDTFSSGILDHNIGETVLKKKWSAGANRIFLVVYDAGNASQYSINVQLFNNIYSVYCTTYIYVDRP